MSVVQGFLDSLRDRDAGRLRSLLTDDVWLRALLVRETIELHDAAAAVALFESWYWTPVRLELEDEQHHPMIGRDFIRYRMRLVPSWDLSRWHRVEQSGYLTVREGRIRRIDLTCTGFFPCESVDGHDSRRVTKLRPPS
jgi:hypothetical protein